MLRGRTKRASTRCDVVVVGGGINGVVCAYEAARRGARVVLLEKNSSLAFEASGRSFGSLRFQGRHAVELPIAIAAAERWLQLPEELKSDIELVRGGNLYVAMDDAAIPELEANRDAAVAAGMTDVRLLRGDELRALNPHITGPVVAGLFSPRDCHCSPEKSVIAFADAALRHSARIELGVRARRILVSGGAVLGVATDAGDFLADKVVLTAGVWTARILRSVDIHAPIQIFVYSSGETNPVRPLFDMNLRSFRFSCRQRPTGHLFVSAGMNSRVEKDLSLDDLRDIKIWLPRLLANRELVNLHLRPSRIARDVVNAVRPRGSDVPTDVHPVGNVGMISSGLDALREVVAAAREASLVRVWGGLIDFSPDGLPILEAPTTPTGLVFLTGLSGHGLALAPVLGRALADLALDGGTDVPVQPMSLARFGDKVEMPSRLV